jgi:hypothetical protein
VTRSGYPLLSRNDKVIAELCALVTTDQSLIMCEVEDNQGISFDLCKGILMKGSMRRVNTDHPTTADSTASDLLNVQKEMKTSLKIVNLPSK